MAGDDRCVSCGEVIPEGMMVCTNCLTASVHAEKGEPEMNIHEATEIAYKNGYEAGKPKWIPVTERLPDKVADYLVAVKFKYGYGTERRIALGVAIYNPYVVGYRIDNCWYTDLDFDEDQDAHITHWMPLPEPPKEGLADGQ